MDAESESAVPAWCPRGCGLGPWDSRGSRKVPWVSCSPPQSPRETLEVTGVPAREGIFRGWVVFLEEPRAGMEVHCEPTWSPRTWGDGVEQAWVKTFTCFFWASLSPPRPPCLALKLPLTSPGPNVALVSCCPGELLPWRPQPSPSSPRGVRLAVGWWAKVLVCMPVCTQPSQHTCLASGTQSCPAHRKL